MEGWLPAPRSRFDLVSWHAHEMLFGFVGAAIGGFLLTAVANWTRRPPVHGVPLFILMLCWFAARIDTAGSFIESDVIAILIDASYFLLLTLLLGREIIIAKNYRNLKLVGILGLFATLNITFHFYPGEVIRASTILVCILISVIGGRIIPAFTGNWLRGRHGEQAPVPPSFNRFDVLVIMGMCAVALLWTLMPASPVTGGTLLLVGVLQLIRLMRWKGYLTLSDPIVIVLHVGYSWLGIGLLFLGSAILNSSIPVSVGLHALGIGSMAGLIMAVASRAALGHTNRPLVAGGLLSVSFVLINLTAVVRLLTAFSHPNLLWVAAALWLFAFIFFTIRFAPIFLGPVPGQE